LKQIDIPAAIHLTSDKLQARDLTFSLSIRPGRSDCRSNRRFITRLTAKGLVCPAVRILCHCGAGPIHQSSLFPQASRRAERPASRLLKVNGLRSSGYPSFERLGSDISLRNPNFVVLCSGLTVGLRAM
jgi:hypothetical protein